VSDEKEFHFTAAVDEDSLRIGIEEREGFVGLEVLHAKKNITPPRRRLFPGIRGI
jgi:hypothetical protein